MIDDLIAHFSAETFGEWCREKFDRFTADPHAIQDPGGFSQAAIVGYVQSLPDADTNRPLLVMCVHAGERINERSSRRRQFEFARRQLQAALNNPPAKVKGLFTQGLFAFHDDEGNFRLSLVSGRAEGRKLVYSDFKRQSFFVWHDRNNKTFRTRMAPPVGTYEQLTAAFSVETLTKEFYNDLFAWYERAMAPASKVTFPNDLSRDDDDRNQLAEHLIRLITRLMFVWFIRQKNLVPEKLFDPAALKSLLKNFDPASSKQDHYYRAILQNLFFATLNCEIEKRDFAVKGTSKAENEEHYGIKILYRYPDDFACSQAKVLELYRTVPFLNGGLFECLDKKQSAAARAPVRYHDGFSREPSKCAHITNNLFFDDRGLITLFSRYDFTVDENDPNDSDVALDPELLGKVFENLLGAYNPETRETARKQSGSFYTPREIVNYMVDESLVAHLRTRVPGVEEPTLRLLLGMETKPDLPIPLRRKLVEALYHCRILDPACGSGAFPMGLLLKMVHLLQRLDDKNTLWHEVVMAEAEKALAEAETLDAAEKRARRQRITDTFEQNVNQPDYARKLYLIENCIFGSDIQPIAVQIAKLRTFITLVCDQTPDPANVAGNYGMLPLPNLETKFVAANSLIGLSSDFADGLKPTEGGSRLDDLELVRLRGELAEVRHRHFRARSAPDKNAYRKQDRELRGQIKARLVEIACKPDAAKIAQCHSMIESCQVQRKAVAREDWREVAQSQPTFIGILESTGPVQTMLRMDMNKDKRDKCDAEIRRLNSLIDTEKNRGRNKVAYQEEADKLAAWDPYDQNAKSPFFDPEWMFGFKDGFDVVIGNPPFGISFPGAELQKLAGAYRTLVHRGESYLLFVERSLTLIKERGHLTFIVPDTYLNLKFTKALRSVLLDKSRIVEIVLLPSKVFEAAVVDTTILRVQHTASPPREYAFKVKKFQKTDRPIFDPGNLGETEELQNSSLRLDSFNVVADSRGTPIIGKMEQSSTRVSDVADVFYGIKAYQVGKGKPPQTRAIVETKPFTSDTRRGNDWLPFYDGKDITRYRVLWQQNNWIRYGQWLAEPRTPRKFEGEKVLIRKIVGERLFATYVPETSYCNTLLFVLKLKPESRFTYPTLLGIANSRLVGWYIRQRLQISEDDTFPQIMVGDIEALPIPHGHCGEHAKLDSLVTRILTRGEANAIDDIPALEAEIDRIVYSLYNLTPDEIAIVEGREPNTKPPATSVAKPAKTPAARQPRKSVMTDDPGLA